jgi:uncharacterized heparinase superfamily protein
MEPGLGDRLAARRAWRRAASPDIAFWPDPWTDGSAARGAALVAGTFWTRPPGFDTLPAAMAIPEGDLWALSLPDAGAMAALHAHGWLGDLAAVGSRAAARRALGWLAAWQDRFGRGAGPGWTPARAARRALVWAGHLDFLAGGAGGAVPAPLRRGLAQHLAWLAARGARPGPGLALVEVASARVLLGLVLDGRADQGLAALPTLVAALAAARADPGAATGRSPTRLLRLATLALRVRRALVETGQNPPPALAEALAGLAPMLRGLAHADGGLARFRGGGRGVAGALDLVLAEAPVAARPPTRPVMGYGRIALDGTSAILDTGAAGPAGSRLAIEVTQRRQPLIVAAGPGLSVPPSRPGSRARMELTQTPGHLSARLATRAGFVAERALRLDPGGDRLAGRDRLALRHRPGASTTDLWLRFPLHPAIRVEEAAPGTALLILPGGGHWLFAHDGPVIRRLEPYPFFDPADPEDPGARPAQAIVLRAPPGAHEIAVAWMLERGADGAGLGDDLEQAARDLAAVRG